MFNFGKKRKEEELACLVDHYRRSLVHRFNDKKYQEVIDNCNLVLKYSPNDEFALEFKIVALNELERFGEMGGVLDKIRENKN